MIVPESPASAVSSASVVQVTLRQALSFGWFAVPSLAILLALGFWQLSRLEWKETLLADLDSLAASPPTDLGTASGTELFSLQEFQPVQAHGEFLGTLTLAVGPRSFPSLPARQAQGNKGQDSKKTSAPDQYPRQDGRQKNGAWIVRPFVLSKTKTLLWVVQGWSPFVSGKAELEAIPPPPTGTHSVTGVLRFGGWYGREFFRPPWPEFQSATTTLYPWVEPEAFAELLRQQTAEPIPPATLGTIGYITLTKPISQSVSSADTLAEPVPLPPSPNLRNQHANYARTWFLLAAALAALWLVRIRDALVARRKARDNSLPKA